MDTVPPFSELIAATASRRRYVTTRKEGIHQLRHYYASVMLAGGVSIKELAEYLGHSDPAFTLRVYAHMLPCPTTAPAQSSASVSSALSGLAAEGQRARSPIMITEQ